jgi:hypothetical protein
MAEPTYSQSPLVKKLAVKPQTRITAANPIEGFRALLGELPIGTTYVDAFEGEFDWITVFVKSEPELDALIETLKQHLKQTGSLWVAIPRTKNPKFNRSTLISARERYEMEPVSNVVINDEWTAYRFRKL